MTGIGGQRFDGAGNHALLADWLQWSTEQEHVWAQEYRMLAERGLSLACNDAFAAALAKAVTMGTIGPRGLRSVSLWDLAKGEAATNEKAHKIRRLITALVDGSWSGTNLDAEGIRTRRDLEEALCWSAFVLGEGWAIRVPGPKGRSAWRLVDPARIKNPDSKPNSPTLRDGMTLANGRVSGIWVALGEVGSFGMMREGKPQFIPWIAADGTPNVIQRVGLRLPNMLRGVSRLAPMVVMLRQIHGVLESHVAAKRVQAIQVMAIEAEDVEAYKVALTDGTAAGSPLLQIQGSLNVLLKPPGTKIDFSDPKFNGEDLTAYLIICYKVLCAACQVPVDVVLCQMGEASLSSARAGLDQFDRTCQTEQEQHIAQVTEPMDRVAIADAWALGEIDLPLEKWSGPLPAKYDRPPKYSTDHKKSAETMASLIASGVSRTTAFALHGFNWEDERELIRAEAAFEQAQTTDDEPPVDPEAPADEAAVDDPANPQPANQPAATWWRRTLAWARIDRIAA